MSTRVLVADDHEFFADGVCTLLAKEPGYEVIGKATNGKQAVQLCREQHPDLVIMDLSMPEMTGIEATRLITAELPDVKILCLSMHADRGYVMGALDAGASGYMLKDGPKAELLDAIRVVMTEQVYLSPAIAGTVVAAARSGKAESISPVLMRLTAREREVLELLALGESTKEIAFQLRLSVKTVGTHRANIMEKLDIHSIAGLTRLAIREGLTSAAD